MYGVIQGIGFIYETNNPKPPIVIKIEVLIIPNTVTIFLIGIVIVGTFTLGKLNFTVGKVILGIVTFSRILLNI